MFHAIISSYFEMIFALLSLAVEFNGVIVKSQCYC